MGYPRVIQPLIIEDDIDAKAYYEAVLGDLVTKHVVAPPHFAFSYEDALRLLNEDTIYHLVILDLRLPDLHGRPPSPDLDFGLRLLDQCLSRDKYPIPVLLVVSAHLDQANQRELQLRVKDGVAYGYVLVKSLNNLETDLLEAVQDAHRYCDVGIYIRDGGQATYPTLSPRDEDLLRRCVLSKGECAGLDLEWWSAEYSRPTREFKECKGWTKVLMGRFLLERGLGPSLPTFFKLAAAGGAETVQREAHILEHKLSHIKLRGKGIAGNRSLLITENVGGSNKRPISLETFLGRRSGEVQQAIPGIVANVVNQIAALGDRTPDQMAVSRLMWGCHDRERLQSQWTKWGGTPSLPILDQASAAQPGCLDPIPLVEALIADSSPLRFDRQTCLHGDLNITNVALDETASEVRAYIFDASGCLSGVSVRDLAMLEVTAVLHQVTTPPESLASHCAVLYRDRVEPAEDLDFAIGSERARNTLKLLTEIRKAALSRETPSVYALMVFDCAIVQLGGLAWLSGNKIRNPQDAALLCRLAGCWLQRVAPELLAKKSS